MTTRRVLQSLLVIAIVAATVIGVIAWWMARPVTTVWFTDHDAIRQSAEHAAPADILWQPPVDLPALVDDDGAQIDCYEPSVAPDGQTLWFVRGRPGGTADLWTATRTASGWSAAAPVDALNTDADELGPMVAPDGSAVYFHSDRAGGRGGYDLWMALREGDSWGEPVNLGAHVNSAYHEYGAAWDADGSALWFASNRPHAGDEPDVEDGWPATLREARARRAFDLFRAARGASGLVPAAVVPELSSEADDGAPALSPAGDFIYFASNRAGGAGGFDLYRARLRGPDALVVESLGPPVNTPGNELDPALIHGGFRLLFARSLRADDAYQLAQSDRREVDTARETMRADVDWSWLTTLLWWLLVASIIALLLWLLARIMRSKPVEQLGFVGRALVASALVHLLLLFLLTLWGVGNAFTPWARDGSGTQVVLTSPSVGSDLSRQVRGELTTVDVTADAPPEMTALDQAIDALLQPAEASRVETAAARLETIAAQLAPIDAPATDAPSPAAPAPASPTELATAQPAARAEPLSVTAPAARALPAQREAAATVTPTDAAAEAQPSAALDVTASAARTERATVEREAVRPAESLADDATKTVSERTVPELTAPVLTRATAADAPSEPPPAEGAFDTPAAAPAAAITEAQHDDPAPAERAADAVRAAAPIEIAPSGSMVDDAALSPLRDLAVERLTRAEVPVDAPPNDAALDRAPREPIVAAAQPALDAAPALPTPAAAPPGAAHDEAARPDVEPAAAPAAGAAPRTPDDVVAERRAPALTDPASTDRAVLPPRALATETPALDAPAAVPAPSPARPELATAAPDAATTAPLETALPASVAARDAPHLPTAEATARVESAEPAAAAPSPRAAPPTVTVDAARTATAPTERAALAPSALPVLDPADVPDAPTDAAHAFAVPNADPADVAPPDAALAAPIDLALPDALASTATPPDEAILDPLLDPVRAADPAARAAARDDAPRIDDRAAQRAATEATSAARLALDAPRLDSESTPAPMDAPSVLDPAVPALPAIDVATPDRAFAAHDLELAPPPTPDIPVNPYEHRAPELREKLVEEMGGTRETERAVALALAWLARYQEANGSWDSDGFDDRCQCGDPSRVDVDIAVTALATLCFLACDHTHLAEGEYQDTVQRAITWLLAQQQANGDLLGRESMYSHGIATLALAEAYAMTQDPALRDPVTRAVRFIETGGTARGGWRYAPGQRTEGDTSVLGWQIMALKSAERGGIAITPAAYGIGRDWLTRVEPERGSGRYAYQPGHRVTESMTAEAMFVQQLLGATPREARQRESASYLMRFLPDTDEPNTYYWYYGTLALFQQQGPTWDRWNARVRDVLVESQITTGTARGSWDAEDQWARTAGRVYQTAICTLTLEVYYRYLPSFIDHAADE